MGASGRALVHVALFPTQTETDGLFVSVLAPTGVAYSNQCGGTGCDGCGPFTPE